MTRPDHELDELLGAYALDAVDPQDRLEIESYLRRSPRASAEVREHHEVAAVLAGAFASAQEDRSAAGPPVAHRAIDNPEPDLWARISLQLVPLPETFARSREATNPTDGEPGHDVAGRTSEEAALGPSSADPAFPPRFTPYAVPSLPTPLEDPAPAPTVSIEQRRASRPRRWLGAAIAAACAAAVLGVATVRQDQRIDQLESELALANTESRVVERLMNQPGTTVVTLNSPDRRLAARIVLGSDGHGYLLGEDLPVLRNGMTYQLWGVKANTVVSLGVFGRHPVRVPFAADDRWSQFVLTAESAPGVSSSGQPAVVSGPVV